MTKIFGAPSRYIQGAGELARLGGHVSSLGWTPYVIFDSGTDDRLGEIYGPALYANELLSEPCFEAYDGPCVKREISRLTERCNDEKCDVVVGIGGGKMLDIAKAVAHFAELPLCVVPTAASTDAPCSALSVLYREDGSFDRYLHLDRNPDMVVVDTAVVAKAPLHMTVAGMGDALATYFEARACAAADGVNELGGKPGAAALAAARACFDTLMECGLDAKRDIERGEVTSTVERVVECNILLSGIGFENGGLALAHAIANGLAGVPGCRAMHGEAVAFGLTVQLALEDAPEREQVLDFCRAVGLPVSLADLGIENIADCQLASIAQAALACARNIANEPLDITQKALAQALRR